MHPLAILFFFFYAFAHVHSLHSSSSVLFQLLHSDPSSCMNHLQQHPQQSQQQQQPHLFFVLCIYRFCAPCACNVCNSSAYSHHVDILHNSSALSDHHRDSSASLDIFPLVQHHCMLCRDSSASLAVETLRLLCDSRAHLLCSSYKLQCLSSCQSPP
jgi:hypothetical protein